MTARWLPVLCVALAAVSAAQTGAKPSPFPARNPKAKTEAKAAPAPAATVDPPPKAREPESKTNPQPLPEIPAAGDVCRATFYGAAVEGARTTSGEPIRNEEVTLAHPSLAFGTEVKLVNLANGKAVTAKVNNRFAAGDPCRINVTTRVARELGFMVMGSADLRLEPVR